MFFRTDQKFKKFVIVVISLVCGILTISSAVALIYSTDKRPLYIIIPIVLLFDVVNIIIYKLYVTKLK